MHAFRRAVKARDFGHLGELFTEHAVLNSPIAFQPYRGREVVATIVTLVAAIFDDFVFQRQIGAQADDYHALMFAARVDNLSIQGCDFLHTNADGLIDEITVMLRPLKAVHAFEEHMKAQFPTAMATTLGTR